MSIASQRKKHEDERKRRQQQATPMPTMQPQAVESAATPEPIPPEFNFASQALEAAFREYDEEEKRKEERAAAEATIQHAQREQAASHAKLQADDQQRRMDAMRAADAQASQMRRESFAAKDSEQRRPSLSRLDLEESTSQPGRDRGEVGDLRGVHAYSTGTERMGHSASMTDFVPERDRAGAGTEHVNPAAWKDHINQPANGTEQGGLVISGKPIKPASAAQPLQTDAAAKPAPQAEAGHVVEHVATVEQAELQAQASSDSAVPTQDTTQIHRAQPAAERSHGDPMPAAQPLQTQGAAKPAPQAEAGQVVEHVATVEQTELQAQDSSKGAAPAQEAASSLSAQRVAERFHADPTPAAQPLQTQGAAKPAPQAEAGQVVEQHVATVEQTELQAQASGKGAAPAQEAASSLSAQRIAERFHADPTPAAQPLQTQGAAKPAPQAEAGQVVEHVATVEQTEPQAQASSKATAPAQETTSSLSAHRVADRFRANDEPTKELPKTEARQVVDLDGEAEHAQDQDGGEGGEGEGNSPQETAMDGQDQKDPAKQQGLADDFVDDYGL